MKTIPLGPGTRPAASAARTSAPSSGNNGRSSSRAPATAFRLARVSARTRITPVDAAVPRTSASTRRASAWASVRRVSCSTAACRHAVRRSVSSHARWSRAQPTGTSVRTRRPGTEPSAERAINGTWAGIPERIAARKRPHRQVQADHRAESRAATMRQPRSESALDPAQLGRRDAGGTRDVASESSRGVRAERQDSAPRSASRRRPRRAPREA